MSKRLESKFEWGPGDVTITYPDARGQQEATTDHSSLRERQAAEVGNSRELLAGRFKWTLSVLKDEVRALFPKGFKMSNLDFDAKRYNGDGVYLQWKLRNRPDLPPSYDNQQTSCGRVEVEWE